MSTAARRRTDGGALETLLRGRVVLVGIGNPFRGDDAAGCLVARGVRGLPGIAVVESEDVPERDLLRIVAAQPDVVLLVDAVHLGAPPGSVAVLEPEALVRYTPTTHRVPLALLADLIRRAAPAHVAVLAIQPGQTAPGAGVSPEVAHSVTAVVDCLRRSRDRGPESDRAATC